MGVPKDNDFMQELKKQKIWFHWVWGKDKNGNPTKIPKSIHGTSCGTDEKYQHKWVTYDEAVEALSTHEEAAGIGFKVPEGYFFLDIDDKELEHPYIQKMLNRFNSYAELSISGKGIHIYGKADFKQIPTYIDEKTGKTKLAKEFYQKNPYNGTEQYIGGITNRFAVFTGNVIWKEDLKDCTQAILTTLDKDMRKAQKKKYSAKRDGNKDIFLIIDKLRKQKNGEKFIKLFDEGDISDYNNDDSAADCALCSLIAFRTGNNPDLIDAIMRQSALMRDKWNRDDGKTIYWNDYKKGEETIFKYANGEKNKIGTFEPKTDYTKPFVAFNQKQTVSVVANEYADILYIVNDDEPIKVRFDDKIIRRKIYTNSTILSEDVSKKIEDYYVSTYDGSSSSYSLSLFHIDSKGEKEKVLSDIVDYFVYDNYLYYIDSDDNLKIAKLKGSELTEKEKISDDVKMNNIYYNNGYIYYIKDINYSDKTGTLYAYKKGIKPIKISTDVSIDTIESIIIVGKYSWLNGDISTDGKTFYYYKNAYEIDGTYSDCGDLYKYTYKDNKSEKIDSYVIIGSLNSGYKDSKINKDSLIYLRYNTLKDENVIADWCYYNGKEKTTMVTDVIK